MEIDFTELLILFEIGDKFTAYEFSPGKYWVEGV
jgi:hypothetical protein